MDYESIKHAISCFNKKRVAVVGDLMLDRYTFGDISRISPEIPVPIIRKIHEKFSLGGAANVANNLVSLGAQVVLCGSVGNDSSRKIFLKLIGEGGISGKGIITDKTKPTTVKHRVISGNHQLLRIDEEDTSSIGRNAEKVLITKLSPILSESDIIVLSDYAKGLFSKKIVKEILVIAKKQGKKVITDLKPQNKDLFIGVDLITPNLKEAKEITGLEDIKKIGPALVNYFNADVFITRGSDGISIFGRGKQLKHIPGKKISVFDVSGAGDTVIATATLAIASGLDLETAAHLANAAGAIVVQKTGTAVLNSEELLSTLRFDSHITDIRIIPKVWGYEKWLENNNKYCCKLLSLNNGYQGSLHYHKNKDEMFLVTKGHVRLEKDDKVLHLREGSFIRLTPGTVHRFRGIEDSLIIEVSTHHDERDVYRIEKSKRARKKLTTNYRR